MLLNTDNDTRLRIAREKVAAELPTGARPRRSRLRDRLLARRS